MTGLNSIVAGCLTLILVSCGGKSPFQGEWISDKNDLVVNLKTFQMDIKGFSIDESGEISPISLNNSDVPVIGKISDDGIVEFYAQGLVKYYGTDVLFLSDGLKVPIKIEGEKLRVELSDELIKILPPLWQIKELKRVQNGDLEYSKTLVAKKVATDNEYQKAVIGKKLKLLAVRKLWAKENGEVISEMIVSADDIPDFDEGLQIINAKKIKFVDKNIAQINDQKKARYYVIDQNLWMDNNHQNKVQRIGEFHFASDLIHIKSDKKLMYQEDDGTIVPSVYSETWAYKTIFE